MDVEVAEYGREGWLVAALGKLLPAVRYANQMLVLLANYGLRLVIGQLIGGSFVLLRPMRSHALLMLQNRPLNPEIHIAPGLLIDAAEADDSEVGYLPRMVVRLDFIEVYVKFLVGFDALTISIPLRLFWRILSRYRLVLQLGQAREGHVEAVRAAAVIHHLLRVVRFIHDLVAECQILLAGHGALVGDGGAVQA